MVLLMLALILVSLATLQPCVAVYTNQEFYTVNNKQAETWGRGYPQSCECAESGATQSDCKYFKCKCTCDLNDGLCDYNCCCDPDCSEDQVNRFKDLEVCSFEGFQSSKVQHCYNSVELYGINPKEPMGGQATSRESVGQALCVEEKNTAGQDDYYSDVDTQSAKVFDTEEGEKDYSYIEDVPLTGTQDDYFDQNDTIAAFTIKSGSIISNGPGYFQLPAADWTGECNDQTYVTFENSVEPQFCTRTLSDDATVFAAQCEQQFSVRRFVTDLYVAKAAELSAADGSPTEDEVRDVQLGEVYFESFTTGAITNITNTWLANSCNTTAYIDTAGVINAGYSTDKCSSYSSGDDTQSLQNATAICQGFVKAVNYIVQHRTSKGATISTVTAEVTVSDVPIRTTDDDTTVTVTQCFGVQFASGDDYQDSRPRSGNPGYMLGKPIKFGFKDGQVISPELASGLSIPSALAPYDPNFPVSFGLAACPQFEETVGTSAVQFGYDVSTGCQLQLNRSALINMCCAGSVNCADSTSALGYVSPYINANSGIPYFLDFKAGYVGYYGNADARDIDQWGKLNSDEPNDKREWSQSTSTCSKMPTNLNIQFLVGFTGSKSNPQNKIIASTAQVETSNWVMTLPPGDETSTQTFPLGVTVSFIFRDEEELDGYRPPEPPTLFYMSYDAFYPFISTNSAPHSVAAGSMRGIFWRRDGVGGVGGGFLTTTGTLVVLLSTLSTLLLT